MTWVLIVIAILLAVLVWVIAYEAEVSRQLIIRASDLNLERQTRIIDQLDEIERHLSQVPKVRQSWED